MTRIQEILETDEVGRDPAEIADRVKESIAGEIAGVDRTLVVKKTEYFNHTYIPDLVVWWPNGGNGHREVFIRFDSGEGALAEDIERLRGAGPMFYSLSSRVSAEVSPKVTRVVAQNPTVLVTNSDAVVALGGTPPGSFEAMLSGAVIQQGRGLVDRDAAMSLRSAGTTGVAAALRTDYDETKDALLTARKLLSHSEATRVEKYLQMLWLAGGGDLDRYPGDQSLELQIGRPDVLNLIRLLLQGEYETDLSYWQRLGTLIDLGLIEELGSVEAGENFQSLIQANLERFRVSRARVTTHAGRLAAVRESFAWSVKSGRLVLSAPRWSAEFADDGRAFAHLKRDRVLPSVEDVKDRAVGLKVEELALDDDSVFITVEPKERDDASERIGIDDLLRSIHGMARVRAITVLQRSKIRIEFDRGVASSDDTKVPLSDFAMAAVALLVPHFGQELDDLRIFLDSTHDRPPHSLGTGDPGDR